ncbi:hypothetical protein QYM36_006023 [Artemia franciscana]|uniref:Reverse transcriptase domain-containing protein n=1 Tax=Artemia franciscana TaxID=6661 RepID=A0AA88LB35_ARTSF|nr:hypothetical protein QYM36_006023 [Artemia franciscana]
MGREVQASLGGSYSEFKIKSYDIGLLQGAVLIPLLFSVYCHDISLENVLGAELFLHTDDIAGAVKLNRQGIVVAEHVRFLGVVFDQKMTWKPHLDELIGSLKQR